MSTSVWVEHRIEGTLGHLTPLASGRATYLPAVVTSLLGLSPLGACECAVSMPSLWLDTRQPRGGTCGRAGSAEPEGGFA